MTDASGSATEGNQQATPPPGGGKTSGTGLTPNVAALLSYLLGFITGIVFLVIEKDDRFVRFHAMQSTLTFGGLFVINIVCWFIPIIGWTVNFLMWPVSVILWIVLMIKAYQNQMFKLPIVGDLAESNI